MNKENKQKIYHDFSIGDVVYFLHNKSIKRGVVDKVKFNFIYSHKYLNTRLDIEYELLGLYSNDKPSQFDLPIKIDSNLVFANLKEVKMFVVDDKYSRLTNKYLLFIDNSLVGKLIYRMSDGQIESTTITKMEVDLIKNLDEDMILIKSYFSGDVDSYIIIKLEDYYQSKNELYEMLESEFNSYYL